MKAQFSFGLAVIPVSVTEQDINHGESRDCNNCAISLAINRTLPLLGFKDCHVRLSPYAAFVEAQGLEIFTDWSHHQIGHIPSKDLPAGLVEWAMDFDDWSEFKEYNSVKDWRDSTGKKVRDYPVPLRPDPISFIFNFGKLQTATESASVL